MPAQKDHFITRRHKGKAIERHEHNREKTDDKQQQEEHVLASRSSTTKLKDKKKKSFHEIIRLNHFKATFNKQHTDMRAITQTHHNNNNKNI